MSASEWLSSILLISGAFFFLAGTAGLLRFPDVYTRLHALTKADNLGLGLTAGGLVLQAESLPAAVTLIVIWLLVLATSAVACYLIAGAARRTGLRAWRKR